MPAGARAWPRGPPAGTRSESEQDARDDHGGPADIRERGHTETEHHRGHEGADRDHPGEQPRAVRTEAGERAVPEEERHGGHDHRLVADAERLGRGRHPQHRRPVQHEPDDQQVRHGERRGVGRDPDGAQLRQQREGEQGEQRLAGERAQRPEQAAQVAAAETGGQGGPRHDDERRGDDPRGGRRSCAAREQRAEQGQRHGRRTEDGPGQRRARRDRRLDEAEVEERQPRQGERREQRELPCREPREGEAAGAGGGEQDGRGDGVAQGLPAVHRVGRDEVGHRGQGAHQEHSGRRPGRRRPERGAGAGFRCHDWRC